mmetsp:Transcript_46362/g.143048  ORF Transcript_46362/g.143048 Transcript_46362/m.143048 type:complete len:254 (-) Transcript_46362:111-872(-)
MPTGDRGGAIEFVEVERDAADRVARAAVDGIGRRRVRRLLAFPLLRDRVHVPDVACRVEVVCGAAAIRGVAVLQSQRRCHVRCSKVRIGGQRTFCLHSELAEHRRQVIAVEPLPPFVVHVKEFSERPCDRIAALILTALSRELPFLVHDDCGKVFERHNRAVLRQARQIGVGGQEAEFRQRKARVPGSFGRFVFGVHAAERGFLGRREPHHVAQQPGMRDEAVSEEAPHAARVAAVCAVVTVVMHRCRHTKVP